MKSFSLFTPTNLIFGCGSFKKLPEQVKKYGKKAMIITTGIPGTDIIERAIKMLEDEGVEVCLYEKVEPNPKDRNIDEAAKLFIEKGCEVAVAIGGGSAIDAAKAVGIIAANGGEIGDYLPVATAKIKNLEKSAPVIAVSTTAGTGSEVTMICVVTLTKTVHGKPGFAYPCMYPKAAIVDPELTLTMPKRATAMVGVDVFFHAMEQYLSRTENAMCDIYAEAAMKTVVECLPKLLEDMNNLELRSKMHFAASLGGLCITVGASSTLHCIGQSVSGMRDTAHGLSLCMFAASFLKNTYDGDIKKYAKVARILDKRLENVPDEEAAENAADAMKAFIEKTGLPTDASSLNLTEEEMLKIPKDVFVWTPRGATQTYKEMSEELVLKMVKDAL